MNQAQLQFVEPFDHHQYLHRSPHGVVLFWEQHKAEKRWTKIGPNDPIHAFAATLSGQRDTYMSVNEFAHWRVVSQLRSLRACYVDVDGCADLNLALEALREGGMPAPSFAVFSGRGLHLYWVLQPVPAQALSVWQAIQDALGTTLAGIGADAKARDCARVLRLVGTVNSKNEEPARGLVLTGSEWTLRELADEVLGVREKTPAKVFDLSAAGARKGKKVRPHTGSIYDRWHLVYRDLGVIADHHWFGGIPEGNRNNFLYLMAVALSWFAHVDILTDEIRRTARTFAPTLTDAEIDRQTQTVVRRAQASAMGKKQDWFGMEVDTRYRYKSDTMRNLLGDLIVPELHDQLRALAPAEVIKKRKAERDRGRWKDHNTGQGVRAGNAEKCASALLMAAKGMSVRQIAAELGVSKTTVSRWLDCKDDN